MLSHCALLLALAILLWAPSVFAREPAVRVLRVMIETVKVRVSWSATVDFW